MTMLTVTATDLADIIRLVAFDERDPLIIWGMPGIGKSEIAAQISAEYDATAENGRFIDVRLSQWESVDLRGIPDIDHANHTTNWNMPNVLPFVGNPKFAKMTKGFIVLFLDELTSASPSVMAAIYQLINDRKIGEHRLMDNVILIAASNRDGDKGVTNRMPTPVANRLVHVELGLDVGSWCHYASSKGYDLGVAFIQFRKPLLSTFIQLKKDKEVVTTDKAFASPRSWFKAFRFARNEKSPERARNAAICGAVGVGPGNEFVAFLRIWQSMISIKKIIADPKGTELPTEASMRYAVAVNISGNMDSKNLKPLSVYLNRMDPEFTILAWKLAVKRDKKLFAAPEFIDYAEANKEVWAPL